MSHDLDGATFVDDRAGEPDEDRPVKEACAAVGGGMTYPFDPLDPVMAIDPYPRYRALRSADPVHRSPGGFWILTRHADIAAMLADTDTFQHCYVETQTARCGSAVHDQAYFSRFRRMVFVMDGPDHARVRRHMHGSLARRLSAIRPRIAAFARELIDRRAAVRRMELIADFAFPLPKTVIGDLLGVPPADHDRISDWASALGPPLEFLPMDAPTMAAANDAAVALEAYFNDLFDRKTRAPGEDHISDLAAVIGEPEGLSRDEAVCNAMLAYIAGHDTTSGAIGLSVLALQRNPSQWAKLVAEPSIAGRAVDELLRYDNPGQGTARVATRDTILGGKAIARGDMILAYLAAGNRDPDIIENPEALDIAAGPRKPLSFGGGVHVCLGQALAKYELQITLELLARECPDLQLETLQPEFRKTSLLRGVKRLNMSW